MGGSDASRERNVLSSFACAINCAASEAALLAAFAALSFLFDSITASAAGSSERIRLL